MASSGSRAAGLHPEPGDTAAPAEGHLQIPVRAAALSIRGISYSLNSIIWDTSDRSWDVLHYVCGEAARLDVPLRAQDADFLVEAAAEQPHR